MHIMMKVFSWTTSVTITVSIFETGKKLRLATYSFNFTCTLNFLVHCRYLEELVHFSTSSGILFGRWKQCPRNLNNTFLLYCHFWSFKSVFFSQEISKMVVLLTFFAKHLLQSKTSSRPQVWNWKFKPQIFFEYFFYRYISIITVKLHFKFKVILMSGSGIMINFDVFYKICVFAGFCRIACKHFGTNLEVAHKKFKANFANI